MQVGAAQVVHCGTALGVCRIRTERVWGAGTLEHDGCCAWLWFMQVHACVSTDTARIWAGFGSGLLVKGMLNLPEAESHTV